MISRLYDKYLRFSDWTDSKLTPNSYGSYALIIFGGMAAFSVLKTIGSMMLLFLEASFKFVTGQLSFNQGFAFLAVITLVGLAVAIFIDITKDTLRLIKRNRDGLSGTL